jgi:uncharacterized protein
MEQDELIRQQTLTWIEKVVVGFNFCPFAARELKQQTIRVEVEHGTTQEAVLICLARELEQLDANPGVETTLIVLAEGFASFDQYLDLVDLCERFLTERDKEGVYQIASFHPDYQFAGAPADDPANYTNRSLYPMLHLLREESISRAVDRFPNPGNIPERNMEFARAKGLAFMQQARAACRE